MYIYLNSRTHILRYIRTVYDIQCTFVHCTTYSVRHTVLYDVHCHTQAQIYTYPHNNAYNHTRIPNTNTHTNTYAYAYTHAAHTASHARIHAYMHTLIYNIIPKYIYIT